MKYLCATLFLVGSISVGCSSNTSGRPSGGGSGGHEDTGGDGGGGGHGGTTAGGAGGGHAGSGGAAGTAGVSGGGAGGSSSGGAGGSGGSTGGAGGAVEKDAGAVTTPDASGADKASGDTGAPSSADAPPALAKCKKPSIDRLTEWNATSEGTTVPMTGSLLVMEGDHYVAKEQFVKNSGGDPWHTLEVFVANSYDNKADLSMSASFTLTYSSTADLWLQMRPKSHYSGGAQWVTKIPSTAGKMQTTTFSFDPSKWVTIDLGKPTWTYAQARKEVTGFVFVGDTANTIAFYGLRFDGYVPMCD